MNKTEILTKHSGLVYRVGRRYERKTGTGAEIDDLVSVGNIALLEAAKRFDVKKGLAFSTYATCYIRGYILCYLRDHSLTIRMPASPRAREAKAKGSGQVVCSLSEIIRPDEDKQIEELHKDPRGEDFIKNFEADDEVKRLLVKLKERERKIIILRHGLFGCKALSLAGIGRKWNCSREAIRQIYARAFISLKRMAKKQEALM